MSKAFTKEDDDIPERVGRRRSGSGLPPGALNYWSERGALLLRRELEELEKHARGENQDENTAARLEKLRGLLEAATIVPTRTEAPDEVLFGTTVTVRAADGGLSRYRIVGVDEASLEPGWVSWVSPLAKSLLGAQVGQQVQLPDDGKVEIVEIAP